MLCYLVPQGCGYYTIVSALDGKVLDEDVANSHVAEFAEHGSSNQTWLVQRQN